jgi:CRISPR-associated endoribonuclease Cas6
VGKNMVTGNGTTLFSLESGCITAGNSTFSLVDFMHHHKPVAPISRVTVTFITPTRIKGSGSFSKAIPFKVLIQTLLTRLTTLAYNYCQQTHYLNFRELVNLAGDIQIIDEQENPAFRSKTTNDTKHSYLGGYIGQITYQGDLTPFWPLLKFAEIIHLGKNCTFGLGKIQTTL